MGDPSATHRRRELARMVEAGLFFFGVADLDQFEGLLDDAEQRAMLRNWLRSEHVPRAAGVADHGTQTVRALTLTASREVSTMATPTFSPSGARLVSDKASQAIVRVKDRALQAIVAVPVADAAVGAAAISADAQTQSIVETADASTDHYLVLGVGLTAATTQTGLDVAALEETVASTLSALDSSQAAQLTLQQRVAELESQLVSSLGNSADATTQTELDVNGLFGLEDGLLLAALGAQDAPEEQHHFESDSIIMIDENSYWQKDSEGEWHMVTHV